MLINRLSFVSAFAVSVFFGTLTNTAMAQSCRSSDEYAKSFSNVFDGAQYTDSKTLPKKCITASMKLMENWTDSLKAKSKPFAYCTSNSRLEFSKEGLCKSEQLVDNIHTLFVATMDCLDIPPKAIFPLFNVESGFFPNAVAPGGEDAGIGQMTPVAAADVNQRWDWLESHINNSMNPSCKKLAPYLSQLKAPDRMNPEQHVCGFVDPEINPLRNALYSGFLFLVNTKYFTDLFQEKNIKFRIESLVGSNVSPEEVHKLVHLLSIFSYNKGYVWMRDKFLNFLETQESKMKVDGELLASLNKDILDLEAQIQEMKRTKQILHIPALREELEKKSSQLVQIQKNSHGPVLTLDAFHYRNFSKNSMIGFLKKQDSSHYIELVLNRNDSIEKKYGIGACGDFEVSRKSSALDKMIWQ